MRTVRLESFSHVFLSTSSQNLRLNRRRTWSVCQASLLIKTNQSTVRISMAKMKDTISKSEDEELLMGSLECSSHSNHYDGFSVTKTWYRQSHKFKFFVHCAVIVFYTVIYLTYIILIEKRHSPENYPQSCKCCQFRIPILSLTHSSNS